MYVCIYICAHTYICLCSCPYSHASMYMLKGGKRENNNKEIIINNK